MTAGLGALAQGFEVVSLEGFGCGIGRGGCQTAQRSDAADGCQMAVALLLEIEVGPVDDGGPAHDIGLQGGPFKGVVKRRILTAHSRTQHEAVHTAHFSDEGFHARHSIIGRHIADGSLYPTLAHGDEFVQQRLAATHHANVATALDIRFGYATS